MTGSEALWQLSDDQLFAFVAKGNEEALALLLLRLQPQLQAFVEPRIEARLNPTMSVEDVLQETYQAVFTNISQFEGSELKNFMAWVRKIAENRLRAAGRFVAAQKRGGEFERTKMSEDAFRHGVLGLVDELSTGDATVSQFVAKIEAVEAIRIAIAALPGDQQAVIRCRYFEQLSVEKIAEKMDRSPGSIRGLLDRARAALRISMHNSALWLSRKE